MSIKYALFENNLTSDPDDYYARVDISGSADLDAIADKMVAQGSTVTKADILAVIEDAITASESLLLDSKRVNFGGLVELYPTIKGTFNGITDGYDSSRHQIGAGSTAGSRVKSTMKANAKMEKTETILPSPSLLTFEDLGSGERDSVITVGNIGTICGHRLKYDTLKEDEGIFFINTIDNSETKIAMVQKNKPGELVFLIPALANGDYRLEVRARNTGNKDLSSGQLSSILSIA